MVEKEDGEGMSGKDAPFIFEIRWTKGRLRGVAWEL
jgi:hypothetical protein